MNISNSEENYLQLHLLAIFVYMKALIKLGRTVDEKGLMDEGMTSFVPQVCNSLKQTNKQQNNKGSF